MAQEAGGQVWEQLLRPLQPDVSWPSGASLIAGVVPTRDEIVAWYSRASIAERWQSIETFVGALPYAVRLVAGLLLASAGLYLIVRSYRRATRPSEADLIRRISAEAQAKPNPRSAVQETGDDAAADIPEQLPPQSQSQSDAPMARPAEVERRPVSSAYPRPHATQAFLTADQFTTGHAPWAVPLGHDLVRIGRHQENDIRLEDKTVHRYHALLHRSPDGDFLIRDLSGQAGNGVYVNGSRIDQAALRPGDLVELGAVRLRFQQQRPS